MKGENMRFLIPIVVAMLLSSAAYAADFDNPLVQGQVMVKCQVAKAAPGKPNAVSVGVVRTDTGERIFCAPAAPNAIVEGMTSVITQTTEEIFLVFHSYSGPDCTLTHVKRSVASTNRYRVLFGAMDAPLLLELVTP